MDPQQPAVTPRQAREERRANSYQPKWRHFHPQARLIMKNPFNHDIVFQVADEYNQPFQYRLPANKQCELPGGAIATLGLKHVVDRLIGENSDDLIRIWEPKIRKKYEDQVIVRVIDPPQRHISAPGAPVDLSTDDQIEVPDEDKALQQEEESFPDADELSAAVPSPAQNASQRRQPRRNANASGDTSKDRLKQIANASIGQKDQIIEED